MEKNKIIIKSKFTGTKILVEEIGQYLFYDYRNGRIYLANRKDLLVRARFEPDFGRLLALQISDQYKERLGWLGWEEWLMGINQIHNAEAWNFVFSDFVRQMELHEGEVDSKVAQEAMEWAKAQ